MSAKKYAPEVRERAVEMVFDHKAEYSSEWNAIQSIASKFGMNAETLRNWVRQAEINGGCKTQRCHHEPHRVSCRL